MAKRNPNGAGSYQVKKNGTIRYTIMDGFRPDGKPNYKYFYGKTKKAAKEKADQYFQDKHDGLKVDAKTNFSDFADFWYESHKSRITETTAQHYFYTLRKIKDCFGTRDIKTIKAADVEYVLDKYQNEGYADSYVRQMRGMMYQIFNKAEANDLIRKNPVRFAEKIRSKNTKPPKEAFTAFEVKLLMEHLPDDRMGNSIRLLLCTGMRSQELLALEPRHIAKDGSYIYILQAVNLVKGTVKIGPPKSKDSIRNIPIPENYRCYAMALRDTNKKFIWEVGKPGVPCNPTYFRDKFREYLSMVDGVRILTPHSCRHTYVSQLQALGVDIPTIQSLCGHAEVDMTQHYLHVQEPVRLAAVERFGKEFGRVSEPDENSNIIALTGSSTEQLNKDDFESEFSGKIRAQSGRTPNSTIIKFPKSY